jgi:hypothetical protein
MLEQVHLTHCILTLHLGQKCYGITIAMLQNLLRYEFSAYSRPNRANSNSIHSSANDEETPTLVEPRGESSATLSWNEMKFRGDQNKLIRRSSSAASFDGPVYIRLSISNVVYKGIKPGMVIKTSNPD